MFHWIQYIKFRILFTNLDHSLIIIKTNNELHIYPYTIFHHVWYQYPIHSAQKKRRRKNRKKIISNYFSTTNSKKRRNRLHDWKVVRPKPITLCQTSRPINRRPRIFLTPKTNWKPLSTLLSCPTRGSLPHPLWSLLLIPSRTHHSSNDCSLNWFLIYRHEAGVQHRGILPGLEFSSSQLARYSDTAD